MRDVTPEQRSLSSSVDELDEVSPKSSPVLTKNVEKDHAVSPKTWPSCPDLSMKENVWQMRQPNTERQNRPSSLYQMRFSSSSPRSSIYSPRSSGYWSELEQLSESDTFSPTRTVESPSPLTQDNLKQATEEISLAETRKTESEETDNKFIGAWQMTRGVFQQGKFKASRTRSTEYLPRDFDCFRSKTPQRINSIPVERHTKKISENNTQRKAFMTDV